MTYFKGSKSDVLNSTVDCTVETGEGYVTLNSYTSIQIANLQNMKTGSMLYNSTTNQIEYYNGFTWVELLTA